MIRLRTLFCLLSLAAVATLRAAPVDRSAQKAALSVVRVNATDQDYDFFRPWSKKNPRDFHGLGAVLPGNRVLVTGATRRQPQFRRT